MPPTWAGEKSALEPRRPYLGFVPSDSALAGPLQPRRGVIGKPRATPLGKRVPVDAEALKGRNPDCAGPRSRPFRATDLVIGSLPRALPWAFLFRPFGAEEGRQTRGPLAQKRGPSGNPQRLTLHPPTSAPLSCPFLA